MTSGEFPQASQFLISGFPVYSSWVSVSSEKRKVLLAPPWSPGTRRGGGGARGGGRSLRRQKDSREVEGVELGVRTPPRRMISQPGCLVRCALWPCCC